MQDPVPVWLSIQKPLTVTSAASVTPFCTRPSILRWVSCIWGMRWLHHVEVAICHICITVIIKDYLHRKKNRRVEERSVISLQIWIISKPTESLQCRYLFYYCWLPKIESQTLPEGQKPEGFCMQHHSWLHFHFHGCSQQTVGISAMLHRSLHQSIIASMLPKHHPLWSNFLRIVCASFW